MYGMKLGHCTGIVSEVPHRRLKGMDKSLGQHPVKLCSRAE